MEYRELREEIGEIVGGRNIVNLQGNIAAIELRGKVALNSHKVNFPSVCFCL
jgi:hypothetical protein